MTRKPKAGWRGQDVLVTGGLGFLGSALVNALVERGAKVRVLDSLLPQFGGSPRHLNGVMEKVDVVIEDTRNRDAVNSAVTGVQTVFHLAAPSGPAAGSGDYLTDLDVACLGTWHLLEAMRVYAPESRVVFTSSNYVYGPAVQPPVTEDAPTDPETLFGAHQLAAEKYFGAYRRAHGLDTVVARLSAVFGPRQRLQSGAYGTVARVLDSALRGEDVPLYEQGRQVRDYLYVTDAVEALLALGSGTSGTTVNVGSGVGMPVRSMAETVIRIAGRGRIRDVESAYNTDTLGLHDFIADVSRLRAQAVPAPTRSFEDAVSETVDWYRSRRLDL